MTLDELASTLPWGLHDAVLEALELDWTRGRLTLTARLVMSLHQELDQRARLVLDGLVFCSIDAPELDPARGYEPIPETGLAISDGPGSGGASSLPPPPEGSFLHWFYVRPWNGYIHVCARDATLTWLEPAPVPARSRGRAREEG